MTYVMPPDEVFNNPNRDLIKSQGAYVINDFENLTFSEKEGMLANYARRPFSRKGLVYPEGVEANNAVKKVCVMLIRSLTSPRQFVYQFCWTADYILRNHYILPKYYCKFSRELWKLTHLFTRKLGISDQNAYRLGRIVATLFQYEELYRFIAQDAFGEVNKAELLNNPNKEIKRVIAILRQRQDTGIQDKSQLTEMPAGKFTAFAWIIRTALWIPRVKKAWTFTVREMELDNLKLDDADRWQAYAAVEYNFDGRNLDDRIAEHIDIYNWHQVKLIKDQLIKQQSHAA